MFCSEVIEMAGDTTFAVMFTHDDLSELLARFAVFRLETRCLPNSFVSPRQPPPAPHPLHSRTPRPPHNMELNLDSARELLNNPTPAIEAALAQAPAPAQAALAEARANTGTTLQTPVVESSSSLPARGERVQVVDEEKKFRCALLHRSLIALARRLPSDATGRCHCRSSPPQQGSHARHRPVGPP